MAKTWFTSRKVHRTIGLILLLPMIGWTLTGLIFFIKPGYEAAYKQISVKQYPIAVTPEIRADEDWLEVKFVRTILGNHLLVRTENEHRHLDPDTLEVMPKPDNTELLRLLKDTLPVNDERYGQIVSNKDQVFVTNTGVEITLDWSTLALRQKGPDTDRINLFYKIHYLQWTPYKSFNQFLGIFGLVLLMLLTAFGLRLIFSGKRRK